MLVNALVFLINFFIKSLALFIGVLINLLPNSPFLLVENFALDYLDTLNWFMPLSFMVNILSYWILAIGLYYLVQIPLRFSKVVE